LKESLLTLVGVSFVIDGTTILRRLNWEFRKGENWVIVGPNGAGKTTLLRLLNGYHWPTQGKVTVLGEPFGRADLRELRRKIGFVSSYITDWIPEEEKVLEVVMSGRYASTKLWRSPSSQDKSYARLLLRKVDCGSYANSAFGKLSQGERQRVVIARALMARPELLIFDEPCAALDLPGREEFLTILTKIAERRRPNMIYVTHRIEEIPPGFTHALLLKEGEMVGSGAIDDVLTDGKLTSCFGVRVKVSRWRNRYYALVGS